MSGQVSRSKSRLLALGAMAGSLALILSGCSGNGSGDETSAGDDSSAAVEPVYDGLPEDLTAAEVCALLDEGPSLRCLNLRSAA